MSLNIFNMRSFEVSCFTFSLNICCLICHVDQVDWNAVGVFRFLLCSLQSCPAGSPTVSPANWPQCGVDTQLPFSDDAQEARLAVRGSVHCVLPAVQARPVIWSLFALSHQPIGHHPLNSSFFHQPLCLGPVAPSSWHGVASSPHRPITPSCHSPIVLSSFQPVPTMPHCLKSLSSCCPFPMDPPSSCPIIKSPHHPCPGAPSPQCPIIPSFCCSSVPLPVAPCPHLPGVPFPTLYLILPLSLHIPQSCQLPIFPLPIVLSLHCPVDLPLVVCGCCLCVTRALGVKCKWFPFYYFWR